MVSSGGGGDEGGSGGSAGGGGGSWVSVSTIALTLSLSMFKTIHTYGQGEKMEKDELVK